MKLHPKFIQQSCKEGNGIDLRQSKLVLKHKPDIIIFEMPQEKYDPNTIFNKYQPSNKPLKKVEVIIANLKASARKYPYAKSDIAVWENTKALWAENHNVLVYNVDSPDELRRRYFEDMEEDYPAVRKDWLFWVYLYIRESYMARNVKWILENYQEKRNPTIAVFLESIHWKHVQFLLRSPSQKEIWKYYFKNFPGLEPGNIDDKIKERNKVLYKYWKKVNT